MILNKTIKPGIVRVANGKYRCRVQRNGTRYETYLPNLTQATLWVSTLRSGKAPKSLLKIARKTN